MKRKLFYISILGFLACAAAIAAEDEVLDIDGGFEDVPSPRSEIHGKWRVFGDGKLPVPLSTTEVHSGKQASDAFIPSSFE